MRDLSNATAEEFRIAVGQRVRIAVQCRYDAWGNGMLAINGGRWVFVNGRDVPHHKVGTPMVVVGTLRYTPPPVPDWSRGQYELELEEADGIGVEAIRTENQTRAKQGSPGETAEMHNDAEPAAGGNPSPAQMREILRAAQEYQEAASPGEKQEQKK